MSKPLAILCLACLALCLIAPPMFVWGAWERFGVDAAGYMATMCLAVFGVPLLVFLRDAPSAVRSLLER